MLVSNSWGVHRYPRELFDELFDGVVISGEEGMRKPARRMYELGAERAGVAPEAASTSTTSTSTSTPAASSAWRPSTTPAEQTIPQLERLLGVRLARTAPSAR